VTDPLPQHLNSYPVVHDSVTTFKNNPYGAKGIDLTNATYAKFVAPTLPYFKGPYSYVAPYVSKADELGDKSLSKIEEKVPIVKSETKEIKQTAFDFAHWPLSKLGSGRDYVLSTYSEEYKKCGGDGLIAGSKAAITSSLVISADVLSWVSSLLKEKKNEARDTFNAAKDTLNAKKDEARDTAKAKKDEARETVKEKSGK
jgi:Perilipin protein